MNESNQPEHQDKKDHSHTWLWVVVSVFIVLAIGGMWAIDFYYSPEMISEHALPEAVGK